EEALQVHGRPHDPCTNVAGVDVQARREVHLVEEAFESRDFLAVQLNVMEVLARANLLLVPAAVAEDEAMQGSEAVALRVEPGLVPRRGQILAGHKSIRTVVVGEEPWVRGSGHDGASE